jgi:hypothetical protein
MWTVAQVKVRRLATGQWWAVAVAMLLYTAFVLGAPLAYDHDEQYWPERAVIAFSGAFK